VSGRTPDKYGELREAAERFRAAYTEYLDNYSNPSERRRLRQRWNELLPAADEAMQVAGRVPGIASPPMLGGGQYQFGLSAVTTGVEQWHGDPQLIFDSLDQTIATLRQWERRPPRRDESKPREQHAPREQPAVARVTTPQPQPSPSASDGRRTITIPIPSLDRTEKIVSLIVGLIVIGGIVYGVVR
jgi:hypothetical protein